MDTEAPSAVQSRMARGALQWGLRAAADAAGVNVRTVMSIENGGAVRDESRAKLRAAYEANGIQFIGKNGARWQGDDGERNGKAG